MSALNWRDDPDFEANLKRLGLTAKRQAIPFSDLDFERSKHNNARNDEYNQDVAIEYAVAMIGGDAFPAIVVNKKPTGHKFHPILSGVHRTGGVQCLVTWGDVQDTELVDCYVLDCDLMWCDLIERAANRWLGRRTSREKAVEDAKWMIQTYHMTIAQCAEYFRIREEWLKSKLRAENTREALQGNGVATNVLRPTTLEKLGQLGFNEKLQTRVAQVCVENGLTAARSSELVDEVKRAATKSEADGIQAIGDWVTRAKKDKKLDPSNNQGARRNFRARFFTHFVGFHNYMLRGFNGDSFGSFDELQITQANERSEVRKRWRELKRLVDAALRNESVPMPVNGSVTTKAPQKKARAK